MSSAIIGVARVGGCTGELLLGVGPEQHEQHRRDEAAAEEPDRGVLVAEEREQPAATNGPMNMPSRNVPPSSDSARARKASGTRVVMNEWRARPKAAAQNPMRKTDAANTPSAGAKTMPDHADERERCRRSPS